MNDYIEELKTEGWQGFKTIAELKSSVSGITKAMGVYMVLRLSSEAPQFIHPGTGGFFKGKDPNVPISELQSKWNDGSPIMYIGKAGSSSSNATLNSRLSQYMKFGCGKNIGHWGGRYIWQLEDSRELTVCWKPLYSDDPRTIEQQMISDFKALHFGRRPFANLND